MEFFATAAADLTVAELQRHLRVGTLPDWCGAIDRVLSDQGERGEIYCLWGQFRVHREIICDGVRFSLPGCPNALQWTVTAVPDKGPHAVTVHCTINHATHEPDFIESLVEFVENWRSGLEQGAARVHAIPAPGGL